MKRHILFLQGMQSFFFKKAGKLLEEKGCKVSRINLCLGDWIFWHGKNCYNFRSKPSKWENYFKNLAIKKKVTDIVLVGERRKYHKEAIKIAHELNIKVIATDFGYLRPDWIAIEEDGLNGASHIPKDIDLIKKINNALPCQNLKKKYSDSEFSMTLGDVLYSFSSMTDFIFFPWYIKSDMRPGPIKAYLCAGYRCFKLIFHLKKNKAITNLAEAGKIKYYLYTMQLEHDFQIIEYSQYTDLYTPTREIISSFANNSDRTINLIIKNHPLDLHVKNWFKITKKIAAEFNVSDRVFFVDGRVNLDKFLENAVGMITINSTSGLRALQLNCPVKTLANPVYDMKGLTYQGKLDDFWHSPSAVNTQNVFGFINYLAAKVHIRGVFFKEPGLSIGAKAFADKIYKNDVIGLKNSVSLKEEN